MKRILKAIAWPFITGSGAFALSVAGYMLCLWVFIQYMIQSMNAESRLLDNNIAILLITIGSLTNVLGISLLVTFSGERWFRKRHEHYLLTALAIIMIVVDVISFAALKIMAQL